MISILQLKKSRLWIIISVISITLCVGIICIVNPMKQYESPYELTSTLKKEDIKSCDATIWISGKIERIDISENEELLDDLLEVISFMDEEEIVDKESPAGMADVSLTILLKDGTEFLLNYKNGVCGFVFDSKTAERFGDGSTYWQTSSADLTFYVNRILNMAENGTTEPVYIETYHATPTDEYESTDEIVRKTYHRLSDGTWESEGYIYKNCIRKAGKMGIGYTIYTILTNKEDITFYEAMMASGLSSNLNDYFDPEESVIVAMKSSLEESQPDVEIVEVYESTPISEIESNYKNSVPVITTTYNKMSNNTWEADGYSYEYMLVLSGKDSVAAKVSTFYVLSNRLDITFEEAWWASGISSNMEDYFDPREAKIVARQLTDLITEEDMEIRTCYYVDVNNLIGGDIYFDLTNEKFYLHTNMLSSYQPYSEGTFEIIGNEIVASVDSKVCYRFKVLDENRIYFVQEGSIEVASGQAEIPIVDGTTLTYTTE